MNTSIRTLWRISCCIGMLIGLFLVAPSVQAQQHGAAAIANPDARALALIKSRKAYLIDVRTPEEYATGHLATSILTALIFGTNLPDWTRPSRFTCIVAAATEAASRRIRCSVWGLRNIITSADLKNSGSRAYQSTGWSMLL